MQNMQKEKYKHSQSFKIIIFGFLAVIILGTLLLSLSISTKDGKGAPFEDALFTATSAVCVTGLIVYDTATHWTIFGQAVILTLIQIGGMGVMTIIVSIAVVTKVKIGLLPRSTMQEAISAHQIGGIVKLTKFIFKMVLLIELIGACIMMPIFCNEFGIEKGIWYSVFHSISAFCNAGFDLMGTKEKFSSLTSYSGNPVINFTIMALIVIGGLGFIVWDDIVKHRTHFSKYRLQSKVVLTVTAILIVIPALYLCIFEFQNMPMKERLLASIFQSVTPRTAGFNTIDLTLLSDTGLMIIIMLMLIGGSPGSTAGGMKTTTLAVLVSSVHAVFRKNDAAGMFGRRISDKTVKNAGTILIMYIALFLLGGMIISSKENIPILTAIFETASAIGTVGLSLGITPGLGLVSKFVLISLMFFGRVGGLTLIFAAISKRENTNLRYPVEKIAVG